MDAKGRVLFDSSDVPQHTKKRRWEPIVSADALRWSCLAGEPLSDDSAAPFGTPVDQLLETNDGTEYAWYTRTVDDCSGGKLSIDGWKANAYVVFLNKKCQQRWCALR